MGGLVQMRMILICIRKWVLTYIVVGMEIANSKNHASPHRRKNRAKWYKNNIGENTYWHPPNFNSKIGASEVSAYFAGDNKKPIIWDNQIIGR